MKKLFFSAAVIALLGASNASAQAIFTPSGSVGTSLSSSSSFVGIGTSSPTSILDINGGPVKIYTGSGGGGNQSGWGRSAHIILTNQYSGQQNQLALGSSGSSGYYMGRTGDCGGCTNRTSMYFDVNATFGGTFKVSQQAEFTNSIVIGSSVNTPAGYKLYVQDGILTEKVKVAVKNSSDWADYVFDSAFELKDLSEVETFITENKHLPDVPSANEVVENGIDMAKMDALLLQKIEELTLYVIQQQKEIEALKTQLK